MANKQVQIIAKGSPSQVGDGFFIRRPMPGNGIRLGAVSPFLLLDHAGPTKIEPSNRQKGVDEHPHRGFETVTISYQGDIEHRDSGGNSGKIGPGDVQWMTAAAGVVHEEKHGKEFTEKGGTLEMIQLWVNLPAEYKMSQPRYQEIHASDIPNAMLSDGESILRVIAGKYGDHEGPAQTFTPITMLDGRLKAGQQVEVPVAEGDNTAVYVLNGSIQLASGEKVGEAEIATFSQTGDQIAFETTEDSTLLILSGEPINEPIASYGPFVMNTSEEIQQAMVDFRSGKLGSLEPKVL